MSLPVNKAFENYLEKTDRRLQTIVNDLPFSPPAKDQDPAARGSREHFSKRSETKHLAQQN